MAEKMAGSDRPRGASTGSGVNGGGEGGARRGFSLNGLFGLRPASGAPGAGAQPQRPSGGMGTFLKGWLLLVVGMYVLQIVLYLIDANLFHGWLETHYIAGSHGGTKPGSAPILGGTTWYLLVFVAMFAGLYYALVRLKILPKDLFGQRSQTQTSARTNRETSAGRQNGRINSSVASAPKPAPLPSGVNPYANRTRAARREAQRRLVAAATAPQPKRGLFGRSKPQPAVAPVASSASKKPAPEPAQAATARPGDNHYQRVRAEQRQRKRRAAKR